MNIIRLAFYWFQLIGAVLVTIGMGLIPLIRCLINHSDIIYIICFSTIIFVGIRLMIMPSVKELRKALKSDRV